MYDFLILTIHYGVNHGSALQAYALARYLNENDCNCAVIDFVPETYSTWHELYGRNKNKYPLPIILLYYPVFLFKQLPNRIRFRRFLKKNVPLTSHFKNAKKMTILQNITHAFLVGSDQVWNNDYNLSYSNHYFLDFVDDCVLKFAYSSSFGKSELSNQEINDVLEYDLLGEIVT